MALISASVLSDRGNAAAILLDGGDPRPSSTTQLRADLLLSLPGLCLLLREQLAGRQCAAPLPRHTRVVSRFYLVRLVFGALVHPCAGRASSCGIRRAARLACSAQCQTDVGFDRLSSR